MNARFFSNALFALIALTLSACGQPPAAATPARNASVSIDVSKIEYDASTPMKVLEEGRALFVERVRSVENIAWNQVIVSFLSDPAMVAWAADATKKAGLNASDAEKVIRYFLAFRNNSFGADPCE